MALEKKIKCLFICMSGINRSKMAEEMFSTRYETKSSGIDLSRKNGVSEELIQWSDIIVTMEDYQRELLHNYFPEAMKNKLNYVLGIPDKYVYGTLELKKELKEKFETIESKIIKYFKGIN